MSIYYQDDYVTLYHGDCLEIADWSTADVLVTDPPYGIGWKQQDYKAVGRSAGQRTKKHVGIQNDGDTSARDSMLELWGDGPGLVFGAIEKPAPARTRRVLVWKKPNDTGMLGQSIWRKDWEPIYVVGKWPQIPATESSVIGTGFGSHRQYAQGFHPHGKPVDTLMRLMEKCPDGVIVDPFAGSGSTLLAAKNLGRKVVGVELEEKYCEIIASRCSQEVLDLGALA